MDKKTGQDAILTGVVESIDDPTYSGRVKVRVKGFHDNIETDKLPWCTYGGSNINSAEGGGSISIARVGQRVRVKFKDEKKTSMEWYAVNTLDKSLIDEIKSDYAGSHILLYDSAVDLSIKFQPGSGLLLYYQGSFIQITPDNNITIHYGEGATGTQIQLSDKRIDIQAATQINLTTQGTINLEADSVSIKGKNGVNIKGDKPGQCAVNGVVLANALLKLAAAIDNKAPQTAGITQQVINSTKEALLNQNINYI